MISFSECTRQNTCCDCDNEQCWHHGDKSADCPKYRCDRSGDAMLDCDHCDFIDRFISDMREYYSEQHNDEDSTE